MTEPAHPDDHVDDLDQRLRRHLEPHPATVARVVRQALRDAPARPRRSRWAWAAVAAAALLALVLNRPAPPPEAMTATPPRLTISNHNGPLAVTTPHGSHWILFPQGE